MTETTITRTKEHYSFTYREHFDAMKRRGALFIKDGDAYDTTERWNNSDIAGANEATKKIEIYVLKDLEGVERDYDYRELLNRYFPQQHEELEGNGKEWHAVPLNDIPSELVNNFDSFYSENFERATKPIIEWLKNKHIEIFTTFSENNDKRAVKLRKLQVLVNERIKENIRTKGNEITIISELAPRFGKTISYLSLFKDLNQEFGVPVMMVPAYWLGALASYEKEVAKYRDYDSMVYVDTKNPNWEIAVASAVHDAKPVVMGISLFGTYEDFVAKHSWLQNCSGQILAVPEEADFGVHTDRQQEKLNYLFTNKQVIKIITSGTNIERMSKGAGDDVADVIAVPYSMLEQQSDDKSIIKRKMYQVKVSDRIQQLVKEYSDSDRPSWSKLLEKPNANSDFLVTFFKGLYGYDTEYGIGLNAVTDEEIRVSIVFVNCTNEAMSKLGKLIGRHLPEHHIQIVNGETTNGADAEREVKQTLRLIREGFINEQNLIILTNNMCSRSFSVGDIQCSVFLTDGGSLDTFVQKQSRCLTPLDSDEVFLIDNKKYGHIVSYSFDPTRTSMTQLQYLYEAKRVVDSGEVGNIAEGVSYVLNSMNLKQVGFLHSAHVQDVTAEMLLREYEDTEKVLKVAGIVTDYDAIQTNSELMNLLAQCTKMTPDDKKKIQEIIKKGRTRISERNAKKRDSRLTSDEKKILKDLMNRVNAIIYSSTTVLMYTQLQGDTFVECLDIIASNAKKDANFKLLYGITATEVKQFVPYLPIELLDISVHNSRKQILHSNAKMNFITNLDKGILGKEDDPRLWYDILSNPEMIESCTKAERILVVAGGHGTEVDVLVKLHGPEITKKIWFNDQFTCFTNLVKLKYNDINSVEGDFTTLQLGAKDMMFDVIIGNPPFDDSANKAKNNKLWHKFVKEADSLLKTNGILGFVTPSSIFIPYVGFGKWFVSDLLKKYTLVDAVVHEPKQYFDVGVGTCHWIVQKCVGQHLVEIPVLRDEIIDNILNKVNNNTKKMVLVHENPTVTKNDFNKGSFEIYYSGKNKTTIAHQPINTGALKIVFPFSAKYENQFVTTESTAHFNRVLYVANQTEAANVQSYTLSKLYRFYAANYMKTAGFTPAVKNNQLPELDNSKTWTDSDVYAHFKLSEEEISYVESKVK